MKIKDLKTVFMAFALLGLVACKDDDKQIIEDPIGTTKVLEAVFGSHIDLEDLENYANQTVPDYITKDNTGNNEITNEAATLGRVLFYDKALSVDNSTSCASCHQQAFAFGDPDQVSQGANGTTGRHSMRLVNARFGDEQRFFWDERAQTLEQQTTMPIQDHAEMGFSGENGDPSIDDLITKLSALDYYKELFTFVYGDDEITEVKMQWALAQFVRSIQSFDSKYDNGRSFVRNNNAPFPNFSTDENAGKQLFQAPPQLDANGQRVGGGAGCGGCHRAPEFDIDENSGNNGVVVSLAGPADFTVTRSPSLRDIFNGDGSLNGGLMHTGSFETFEAVLNHYNEIPTVANGNGLDRRLSPPGGFQRLNLTADEKRQLEAFVKTLSGTDIYTNEKWSNPFI